MNLSKLFSPLFDFFNLFFPDICPACGNSLFRNENIICTKCLFDLPKTNFHDDNKNIVSQTFWGRVNFEAATSFLYYNKGGKLQKLIHQLKYNGNKMVGYELGRHFGAQLSKSELFSNADYLVPVPLHPKREYERGYNQSLWICKGLKESMNIQINDNNVKRKIYTKTQTKKTRTERWENVSDIFEVKNPSAFSNKKIIIIDDIITTGSTIDSLANTIIKNSDCKLCIASLGIASQ